MHPSAATPTAENLRNPPIVEAVLDIDCDVPPGFALPNAEAESKKVFSDKYPKFRTQFLDEHTIEQKPNEPSNLTVRRTLQSLQFRQEDEKQLVQVRAPGFSFNRLAPYTSLDDYLPEIERTWNLYTKVTIPTQVRAIRLRYINRILIPLTGHHVELENYFTVSPRLPEEDRLTLLGFLHQHSALEASTGHQATIVLTSQPVADGRLPVIFDIQVSAMAHEDVGDWARILTRVRALRDLKNRIFRNTLTEKCLSLFRAQ